MFPRYFSGEITNWPRLPCYSLFIVHRLHREFDVSPCATSPISLMRWAYRHWLHHSAVGSTGKPPALEGRAEHILDKQARIGPATPDRDSASGPTNQ